MGRHELQCLLVRRSSLLMQGYEQTLGLTGEQGQYHLNIQACLTSAIWHQCPELWYPDAIVHCHYRSHDSLTPTTVLCWLRRIETQFALNLEELHSSCCLEERVHDHVFQIIYAIYMQHVRSDEITILNERNVSELVLLYGQMVSNGSVRLVLEM